MFEKQKMKWKEKKTQKTNTIMSNKNKGDLKQTLNRVRKKKKKKKNKKKNTLSLLGNDEFDNFFFQVHLEISDVLRKKKKKKKKKKES